jgi:hypothetical protein
MILVHPSATSPQRSTKLFAWQLDRIERTGRAAGLRPSRKCSCHTVHTVKWLRPLVDSPRPISIDDSTDRSPLGRDVKRHQIHWPIRRVLEADAAERASVVRQHPLFAQSLALRQRMYRPACASERAIGWWSPPSRLVDVGVARIRPEMPRRTRALVRSWRRRGAGRRPRQTCLRPRRHHAPEPLISHRSTEVRLTGEHCQQMPYKRSI